MTKTDYPSDPSLALPKVWEPLSKFPMQSDQYSYTSCHWSDVAMGRVVPKHVGQIFFFADLGEMWVYVPPEEHERDHPPFIWVLVFTLVATVLILSATWLSLELAAHFGWFA